MRETGRRGLIRIIDQVFQEITILGFISFTLTVLIQVRGWVGGEGEVGGSMPT